MLAVRVRVLVLALFSMLIAGRPPAPPKDEPTTASTPPPNARAARAALAKVPVAFEANAGQHASEIRFVARRGTASVALRDDGATLVVVQASAVRNDRGTRKRSSGRAVIGLKVDGGRAVVPQASEELVTKVNYFTGKDPAKWRTNVPTYAKVMYPSVLDGVDLVYHGEGGALEYDFVVSPGAEVDRVAMTVEGANRMSITEKGELRIQTATGDVIQPPPVVYQRDASGAKHTIASSYRIVGERSVGFVVSAYDRTKALVIDPVLAFATYVGGASQDVLNAVAADANGNTYVSGHTWSTDFPTQNAYDAQLTPSCVECGETSDVFISKLDASGMNLLYSTYLGGESNDSARGIAVGADGTAYLTGTTTSPDFPLVNAINGAGEDTNGFVARLNAAGDVLVYSTYLSGSGDDEPAGIAVDASGIYVAGSTRSSDLGQNGGNGQQPANAYDAFVAKLTPTGSEVTWVKYLGGSSEDLATGIASDASGNAYISGYTTSGSSFPQTAAPLKPACQEQARDAFVAKINAAGTVYATCLGGAGEDRAMAIAVDSSGSAYVAGYTTSSDFAPAPIHPFGGVGDAFVAKLTPAGTALEYSTVIGGSDDDGASAIAIDSARTAWITGFTASADFPSVVPFQAAFAGGGRPYDAFVSRIDATGTQIVFSSFYGGATNSDEGFALAVNGSRVHLGGNTFSTDLPFVNGRQQTNAGHQDGFVATLGVPPLLIAPANVTLLVGDTQQFTAAGGAGLGYVFSLQTNASGATITPGGAYSAGQNGGTIDVVRLTDASGVTATATVKVGQPTPPLAISPTSATVAPKGSHAFTASGGVAPHTFSLLSNGSGGAITPSGSYTAGPNGDVVDVIQLSDSAGSSVNATVTVGPSITISPAQPQAPPNGAVSFSASGGSGSGYVWAIAKNGSNASIGASTGSYKAGSGASTVDTVQVTDSLGNKASVNVSIGGGLAISPADPTTTTRGSIAFTAVGGSGAYTWSLTTSPSGGTIDGASGAYVAGATGNTIDTVRVQDSLGNSSSVQVSVGPGLTITPPELTVATGGTVTFGRAGGSGTGYAFTLTTNASGGSVSNDGVYVAGEAAGIDVVRLRDSLGSAADDTVTVTATASPAPIPDGGGGAGPGNDAGAISGLNIGGGGVSADCTCRAACASKSSTAAGVAALALVLGVVCRRRRRR